MFLDFRKIFAGVSEPYDRTLSFDLSDEDFMSYSVKSPVLAKIKAELNTSAVRLDLNCDITVISQCARCTKDIEQNYSISRKFYVKNEEWLNEEGNFLPFSAEGKLDIKELLYSEIMLEIPTVLLCDSNCEGLCAKCGKAKPCNCSDDEKNSVDERLLPLLQLLTD